MSKMKALGIYLLILIISIVMTILVMDYCCAGCDMTVTKLFQQHEPYDNTFYAWDQVEGSADAFYTPIIPTNAETRDTLVRYSKLNASSLCLQGTLFDRKFYAFDAIIRSIGKAYEQ